MELGDTLVAQMVKNPPAMLETGVWSLGWKDPLEKEMTIHTSTLAWRIPWIQEPAGLQSTGLQRVRHDWATNTHTTSPIQASLVVQMVKNLPAMKETWVQSLGQRGVWLDMTKCSTYYIFKHCLIKSNNIKDMNSFLNFYESSPTCKQNLQILGHQ